jgi:tetratricopeptide (TPR) repeat protein
MAATGDPFDASPEVIHAREQARDGALEAALARVDRILHEQPRNVEALKLQHLLRLRLHWMCGAFEPLAARVEILGRTDDARGLLRQYRLSMNCDAALALLDRASAQGEVVDVERLEVLVECRRFESARAWARTRLERGGLSAATATRLALLCLEAGDGPLAHEFAQQALREAPEDSRGLALAGTFALWSGDLARAGALARRALGSEPSTWAAGRLAGQVALMQADIEEAIRHFVAVLDAAPTDHETLVLLAEAHRRSGSLDAARTCLKRAAALGGPYSLALDLNELLVNLQDGRMGVPISLDLLEGLSSLDLAPRAWDGPRKPSIAPGDARPVLKEGLSRLSGNRSLTLTRPGAATGTFLCVRSGPGVRAACIRVRDLLKSGGFDAAIAAHDALLSDFGHSPLVYSYRGELLLWAGRYDQAWADFDTALGLDVRTRWAWVGLGACELLLSQPRNALRVFEQAAFHVQSGLTTHVYQGEALRVLGDRDRSIAEFGHALELHPSRASVHLNLIVEYAFRRDRTRVAESLAALRRLVPGFRRALLRETATDDDRLTMDLEQAVAVAEDGLRMMRGNRSSGQVTWFEATGRAHAEQAGATQDAGAWSW